MAPNSPINSPSTSANVTIDRDIVDAVLEQLDHGFDVVKGFATTIGERLGRERPGRLLVSDPVVGKSR